MQMFFDDFNQRGQDIFRATVIENTIQDVRAKGEDVWLIDKNKKRIAVVVLDVDEAEDSLFELSETIDEKTGENILQATTTQVKSERNPRVFRAQPL